MAVLHWRILCWVKPSGAPCLRELWDVEGQEAVGELCSALLWVSDEQSRGRIYCGSPTK